MRFDYVCKYKNKADSPLYIRCLRDNSIRHCEYCKRCPKFRYEPTKKDKIKLILRNLKHLILGI